jgi:hypothetical protein
MHLVSRATLSVCPLAFRDNRTRLNVGRSASVSRHPTLPSMQNRWMEQADGRAWIEHRSAGTHFVGQQVVKDLVADRLRIMPVDLGSLGKYTTRSCRRHMQKAGCR